MSSTQRRFKINDSIGEISFAFESGAYRKEALYGAALVFSDRCYVYVEKDSKKRTTVVLKGKKNMRTEDLESLAGEFHNELLSQTLRWMVARHNRKTREAIEIQALYAARGGTNPSAAKKGRKPPMAVPMDPGSAAKEVS